MAYTWFRHDSAAVDHPKVMRLRAELQEPLADAYLSRVWSWVQRYAPTGFIPVDLLDQLEVAIGTPGPPISGPWAAPKSGGDGRPQVVEVPGQSRSNSRPILGHGRLGAMLKVGLLDAADGGVEVHDWAEMQGKLVEKSERDAAAKRERRRLAARDRRKPGARRDDAELEPKRDGRDVTDETLRTDDLFNKNRGSPTLIPEPHEQRFIEFLDWKSSTRRAHKLPVDVSPPARTPDDDWWADLEKCATDYAWAPDRLQRIYAAFLDDRTYRVDGKTLAELSPAWPITVFALNWRYWDTVEAMPKRGAM